MKKVLKYILLILIIIPVYINASSNYYDSVDLSQKYINNFKFHNNYLKYSIDLPWEYDGKSYLISYWGGIHDDRGAFEEIDINNNKVLFRLKFITENCLIDECFNDNVIFSANIF